MGQVSLCVALDAQSPGLQILHCNIWLAPGRNRRRDTSEKSRCISWQKTFLCFLRIFVFLNNDCTAELTSYAVSNLRNYINTHSCVSKLCLKLLLLNFIRACQNLSGLIKLEITKCIEWLVEANWYACSWRNYRLHFHMRKKPSLDVCEEKVKVYLAVKYSSIEHSSASYSSNIT